MRRYAANTVVPVSRSRAEIDELLRNWKCDQLSWTDDFANGAVRLQFVWTRQAMRYAARFSLAVPSRREIQRQTGAWTPAAIQQKQEQVWRHLHRVLLLWLKGCFNAVEAGLVSAEAIFLPFLVGANGQTVAEVAIPQMTRLLTESADRLLVEGPA